jgi:hypothetical protein
LKRFREDEFVRTFPGALDAKGILNIKNFLYQTPTDKDAYSAKVLEIKNNDVSKFFNQGAIDGVTLESDNTMTFKKPFFGNLRMKFISIGKYNDVKQTVPGALTLDENSQSQVFFLQKYLGNYDIDKIGSKFLIRNGNYAIVAEKDSW